MKNFKFTHTLLGTDIHILAKDQVQAFEILEKWYKNISDYYLN